MLQTCLEPILLENACLVVSGNFEILILMSFTWNVNKRIGAKKIEKAKVELVAWLGQFDRYGTPLGIYYFLFIYKTLYEI